METLEKDIYLKIQKMLKNWYFQRLFYNYLRIKQYLYYINTKFLEILHPDISRN